MYSSVTNMVMPPAELRRKIISRSKRISMPTSIAGEALELAQDQDCTIEQFARVVERDVRLAAEILSLSNSVLFSSGKLVANLKQAIIRIGFRQCQSLILTTSAASLMRELPVQREPVRDLLWQHSSTAAIACMFLNRSFSLDFHGEEYSAGLLHDFGRILLIAAVEDAYEDVESLDFEEDNETLDRERELFGIDHCAFGAWFAEHMGLPTPIVDVIRWHHEPSCAYRQLVALAAAGDHIANYLQRNGNAKAYDPESNWAIAQLSELCHPNIKDRFAALAPTLLDDILHDSQQLNKASEKKSAT